MHRERKELIRSLDLLIFSLFTYVWFLDGSTLWLTLKAALQIQFCNPVTMHPSWPLPFITTFVASFNAVVALVHLFSSGRIRSILIDFIGQDGETSKLHLLFLDALTAFIQIVLVFVAYEHGKDELRPEGESSNLDEDPTEQGWDARDEEASLDADSRTALTHPVAVIRLGPLFQRILHGELQAQSEQPRANPNTSRLRSYSRRPRPAAQRQQEQQQQDWPPMWLVLARNMTEGRISSAWQRLRDRFASQYRPINQHE